MSYDRFGGRGRGIEIFGRLSPEEPWREPHPEEPEDRYALRDWWHGILRVHGKYPCFAALLVLQSDTELIRYVVDFGAELDQVSGKDCLVVLLTETEVKRGEFGEELRPIAMRDHVEGGYGLQVAKVFDITIEQFPCLVIFRDIRSPEHILITLKGMTAEDIAQRMRSVFATIDGAVSSKKDPLAALDRQRNKEVFLQKGKSIVSRVQTVAGRTFEIAVEALIKASVSP